MTRARAVAFVVLFVFTLSGCPQSLGSICQHMVDSLDAMCERCGLAVNFQVTFDGTTRSDCGHVTRISDGGNAIVHQCIPWSASVECNQLVLDGRGVPELDPSCDFSTLQGHP